MTDLSYARNQRDENTAILALDVRGWNCAWAIYSEAKPLFWGRLGARDHKDGKPVPQSTKIAGLFRSLLEAVADHDVSVVVTEVKANPGPIWSIPPLLAATLNTRYAELRDWIDELDADRMTIRSWATVTTGKPVEDELVANAIGLAVSAIKLLNRQRMGTQELVW